MVEVETVRHSLREATSCEHAALERAVGDLSTRGGYVRYVRGLYLFRSGVETWLASSTVATSHRWQAAPLAPSLRYDLADLGQRIPELHRYPPTDMSDDIATLLGVLYVVEGSALGAKVLTRSARRLGFSDKFGARHLAVQREAAANWPAFAAMLNQAARDAPAAIERAREVFRLARRAMEEVA